MKPEQIKKLMEGISEPPWGTYEESECDVLLARGMHDKKGMGLNKGDDCEIFSRKDAEFIAQAPAIIAQLLKQLEVAKEAVAFYADSYTWVSNSGKIGINPVNHDITNIPGSNGATRFCGGNKAREALQKIEQLEQENGGGE